MKRIYILGFISYLCIIISCAEQQQEATSNQSNSQSDHTLTSENTIKVFEKLSSASTGISFANTLSATEQFNNFTYEYSFNGAGVGVGDINNDGLPDIYFAGNLMADRLYLNKGNMQFEDITVTSGIGKQGFSSGVNMADVNGDGYLDIYVCRTSPLPESLRKNVLFINNGDATFTDRTDAYGLGAVGFSSQSYFFDYDKDGDLDMYLVNHRMDLKEANNLNLSRDLSTKKLSKREIPIDPLVTDHLYRNEKGKSFVNVSKQAGIQNHAFGLSAAIIDINHDGWEDIFVGNDFIDEDYLYINQKDGTFKEHLDQYFRHSSRNSMGCDVADINNDGLLDIAVVDMMPEGNHRQKMLKGQDPYDKFQKLAQYGGSYQVMRNVLQLNNGMGGFSEIGELAGVSRTDWSWAPLFADFDGNGYKDLFIANGIKRDITDLDAINYKIPELLQQATDKNKVSLVNMLTTYPSNKVHNYIYKNDGNLHFEEVSKEWGLDEATFSNGAAYADLDADGDLDLIISNIDQEASIYANNSNTKTDFNYLKFRLKGDKLNSFGIGAKVIVYHTDGTKQVQVLQPSRGYLSSMEPILYFGVSSQNNIKNIEVIWTSGKMQTLKEIKLNTTVELKESDATQNYKNPSSPSVLFTEDKQGKIDFVHQENKFIDFDREPLLTQMISKEGPSITVADVNNDGLDDVFIGGASGKMGVLYFQQNNGSFKEQKNIFSEEDFIYEDIYQSFFDADQDGDLDLYICSGGNAFDNGSSSYQDRLYINNGKGAFEKTKLPEIHTSSSCVVPFDIDEDGDLDLFVSGRVVPGAYPERPQSYILINENGQFTDHSESWLPNKGKLGMITDVSWQDIDGDQKKELILIGDWMPLTILKKVKDKLVIDKTISKSHGRWNRMEVIDIDQDGDLDIIAGNRGLNDFYKVSPTQPAQVYYDDFDHNGQIDPITCYYVNNVAYPMHTRDMLIKQIPLMKKSFGTYAKYADAKIEDVLSPSQIKASKKLICETTASSLFLNNGKGDFSITALPIEAQTAPVQDILAEDVDRDGLVDLLLVGNEYETNAEIGRYDAFNGLFLKGTMNGFKPITTAKSGFYIPQNARSIQIINRKDGKKRILVSINNGKIKEFEL